MNYFWLIRNCFLFFCFRLSLLLGINSIFLSLLSLSLCLPHCFSVFFSILKVFSLYLSLFFWCSCILFFCSHDAVCLFLCIFQYSLFEYLASFRFFKVMLSCGIVIFHSSPTNKTSAKTKTALIIFNIPPTLADARGSA